MDSSDGQTYIDLVLDFFAPIRVAIDDADQATRLLIELGYIPPADVTAFQSLAPALSLLQDVVATIVTAIENNDEDALEAAVPQLLQLLVKVFQGLNSFDTAIQANFQGSALLTDTDILTEIVRKLVDYLLVVYLEGHDEKVFTAALLMGFIELEEIKTASTGSNTAYLKRTVKWDQLSAMLSDPLGTLKGCLVDSNGLKYRQLLYVLAQLGAALDRYPTVVDPTAQILATFNNGRDLTPLIPPPDPPLVVDSDNIAPISSIRDLSSLSFPLLPDPAAGLAVMVYPVLDTAPGIRYTAIGAGLRFGSDLKIPIGDTYEAAVKFSANLSDSLGFRVDTNGQFTFIDQVFTATPQALADSIQFAAQVAITPTDAGKATPLFSLGTPQGSSFQIGSAALTLGIEKLADLNLFVEVDLADGLLVLKTDGADGFLAQILPPDGIQAGFSLGVGFSSKAGLYFTGSSGLTIRLPLHLDLGPINVDDLTLSLTFDTGKFPLVISAGVSANLGPLQAAVDEVGVQATFEPRADRSGNAGPLQITFGFKPPKGVGLAIDACVVQGGGYLYIDTDRGEYAGALQLMFADFLGLQAIGLITTKMPDGSSGFSLLIIITVDFGAGIQLGFGFTLLAVGGLLGLNRSMLFQPLMDGIRTDSIESIMFPQDVIANAPRIISDLRAIFPPQEGTFLVGPMAKLGWGEPTLISLALGIIIEIPPGDIAILGILKLALPADDIAVLLLQVNFAGALEFDKQRLYFFASLYDSHVLFITLEGEMGLLMAWGGDANFVVSIGGFHPQFNPPPLPFPSPKRIEVDIINESFARIRCDGYFAVTTNTVQFGSHSEFFFGFSALNLSGSSGFDALIQFSPFHFTVAISTSFSVNVFGIGCYGIDMDLTLEGPTPWHAHGTASISFLFFSIGIGVDFTWGDRRNTMLPPIAVMPVLSGEFGKQSNWKAVLPSGSNLLVVLRQLDPSEAAMVLHPVGTLHVSQRAVPLDLTLDKDGNQQPSDANYFTLDVTSGGLSKTQTLTESFAPAQFKNMDDATKLSQPAYVPMDSGIELSAAGNAYASGTAITRNVRYDLTVIDTKFRRVFRRFFVYTGSLFVHFLNGSSVTRSAFSAQRAGQAQPYSDHVAVNSETFAVALQSNNQLYSAQSGAFSSQAAAHDYLSRAVAQDPTLTGTLHVLPQFEVAA